jgi:putative ABC transport system permease protein
VKVGGHSFRVVGVLEKMGNFLGLFSLDTRVVIPISQYFQHFKSYHSSIDIGVKIRDVNNLEDAREELRGIMRKVRHVPPGAPDDFAINQQELLINTFNSIGVIIAAVGLFITGLALTVGGIGIMNIMFVSVTERTREIGIRKALGARRITILVQFLIESAAICLFGGLIGLAIAFPMSILIDRWVLPTAMPVSIVVVAIFVSLAVGVISGSLPAYRASKLDPVEALRYE